MYRTFSSALSLLALLAVACGGPARPVESAQRADDEEDEDGFVDEEPEEEDDRDDAGFVDSALMNSQPVPPLELGEPTEVPGTGVTLRPPEGSQPMPFGGGFLAPRQRVQLSVVVAEGGEDVLEAIRTGGAQDAPEPDTVEEVTIAGQNGRIGRDRVRSPAGVLERTWLLVHDGTRGLGVVATYEADRASQYRGPLRESLAGVRWERDATLDAEAALGIHVGPVEGLEPSHRSTANLVLLPPNAPFPPEAGHAVVSVSPLPMQVPADRIAEICPSLASRLLPVAADELQHEGAVEDGALPGCERLGTAQTREGQEVVTYAALLFHEGMPILLTASVDSAELSTWRPRFASAARSIRVGE